MCGILGFLDPEGPDRFDLDRILATIAHRGPDGRATRRKGAVGLAVARLEIVGAEAGAQPMRSERGSLLALNGEIYNWPDLLDDEDARSDTAVLQELLDREGPAALAEVRGGYALAWSPTSDRVVLARDPFGQRPLYWTIKDGALVFASELRALFAAGVAAEIDEEALAALVRWQFLPPGRSLVAGVTALRPGEILDCRLKRGVVTRRSSRVDLAELATGVGEEDLAEMLQDAAFLQGELAVPAAILLSGGLDSSATLALLAREGRAPGRALVGFFPEAEASFDERPFARIAARAAGVALEEVAITARDFAAAMPRTIAALEEPVAGPGAVSQFLLCERAARDVRVLFAGQGGDELFGGYERLHVLARMAAGLEPGGDPAYAPLVARMSAARERAGGDLLAAYGAAVDRGASLRTFGGPRALELLERAPDLLRMLPEAPRAPLAFAAAFEWEVLLPGLLQVDDRCAAAFGLEGRSLFLDQPLAAELLAIPLARKSPPAEPRALFRRLLSGLLPAEILARRDKLGFPVPLADWWRGPLRDFAGDRLGARAVRELGLVAAASLDALLADDGQGGRLVHFLLMLDLALERLGHVGDAETSEVAR